MNTVVTSLVLLLSLLAGSAHLAAQTRKQDLGAYAAKFTGEWVKSKRGGLTYFLHAPRNVSSRKPVPLVLTLHGSAEVGGKGAKVPRLPGSWSFASWSAKHPCIVLAPQCPARTTWMSVGGDQVLALLDDLLKEVRVIDKNRIYMTGFSLGGFGTWHLAAKRPDLFAAIAPVAGGGQASMAPKLRGIDICMFHGASDPNVPFVRAVQMAKALEAAGIPSTIQKLKAGHGIQKKVSWDKKRKIQTWLFKQRRGD